MTSSNLIAIAFVAASLFFFIQDEDETAISLLFLAVYGWIATYYSLRAFWYDRYQATFNEIFFLFGAHIIPIVCLAFSNTISFGDPILNEPPATILSQELNISILSFLALPFLIFATVLQFRCFTKYSYIRYGAQSTSGLPAESTGLVLFFTSGYALFHIGLIAAEIIGVMWGLFFLLAGLGWLSTYFS